MTLLLALLWPTFGLGFSRQVSDIMGYITSTISSNILRGGMKEKNEDDNCEYEMMWDAEGSMHLIKKALKAPSTAASADKVTVERQAPLVFSLIGFALGTVLLISNIIIILRSRDLFFKLHELSSLIIFSPID